MTDARKERVILSERGEPKDPFSPKTYRKGRILRLRRLSAASFRMTYILLFAKLNNNLLFFTIQKFPCAGKQQ